MNKSKLNLYRFDFMLFSVVLVVAASLRFANIFELGFSDTDEYAAWEFLNFQFAQFKLEGVAGSMWGRPFGYMIAYLWGEVFGPEPAMQQVRSAFFGLLTVVVLYFIGEKYIRKNVGLFASAFSAVLFAMVFYSRNMKLLGMGVFFCSLNVWILFSIVRQPYLYKYILLGLLLGMMITTHPNTLPMAAVMLFVVAMITLFKIFTSGASWRLLFDSFAAPFMLWAVTAFWEQYFVVIKEVFKFWDVENVGYLKNLLYHANLGQHAVPSFDFYLASIAVNGQWFLYLTLASVSLLLCSSLRRPALLLLVLFWGAISLYVVTEMVAVQRNVLSCMIPACLVAAAFVVCILDFFKKFKSTHRFLRISLLSFVLVFGVLQYLPYTSNVSSAQQIYDYAGTSRISLSKPAKSIYYWNGYYFGDSSLFVETWEDVFRNYASKNIQYAASLRPGTTNVDIFFDPNYSPSKTVRNLQSNKVELEYPIFDLNQEYLVFEKELEISKISEASSVPIELSLSTVKVADVVQSIHKREIEFQLSIPANADLMIFTGRIDNVDLDTFLVTTVGDQEHPYLYDALFQQSFASEGLNYPVSSADQRRISLQNAWKLNSNSPKDLRVSFVAASKERKLLQVTNLKVLFYKLPQERLTLIDDVAELKADPKKFVEIKRVLRRFGRTYSNEIEALDDNVTQIDLNPSKYKPNAEYEVTFKARTNFKTAGRVSLNFDKGYWQPTSVQLVRGPYFWSPKYRKYAFRFRSPLLPKKLVLIFENAKPWKKDGHIDVQEISVKEVFS